MGDKLRKIILPAAFWLLVWTLAAAGVGRELILPSPLAVGRALCTLAGEGTFWRSVGVTLLRVCAGFLLGSGLGLLLGALTAGSKWCDALLSPALRAVRTVPVVSFILLLYFALPSSGVPVAVSALMALPVVWRAAREAIAAADGQLLELCGAYRLTRWQTFRLCRLPAALPALCAGWETALGLVWKSALAAEVLCQPKWAAGAGLQAAKSTLDIAAVAAWTVAVVCLSLLMEGALRRLLDRWKGGSGQ